MKQELTVKYCHSYEHKSNGILDESVGKLIYEHTHMHIHTELPIVSKYYIFFILIMTKKEVPEESVLDTNHIQIYTQIFI